LGQGKGEGKRVDEYALTSILSQRERKWQKINFVNGKTF
jgi:hypothetical protein